MAFQRRLTFGLLGVAALAASITLQSSTPMTAADKKAPAKAADKKAPAKAAVERTREHVTMLDDLYKTAVVGITQLYVNQQADKPAALAAKAVFEAMKKKGWHNARLVDASGDPKSDDNLPKTDFEKKAAKAMKEGKKSVEEIAEVDGKHVLRTATVVPAVLKSCAKCHSVEEGAVLGMIVYELPIK